MIDSSLSIFKNKHINVYQFMVSFPQYLYFFLDV